jgi:phosphoheptose isomerase
MKSFDEYFSSVNLAAAQISRDSLEQAFKAIDGCARLYIMGNGGSAANADHWVCDYMKGINEDIIRGDILNVKAISLASNGPLVTALANDLGYEHIFAKQLQYYRCQYGDVVLAMSASGNSKNVVNGLLKASHLGATTVALTGFTGGEAAKIADISVHVPSSNYGVVEDCHMMILHAISQRIRYRDTLDRESLKL